MLRAGGLPLLTDGVRAADEDNPEGYFEYEAVKRTCQDAGWLASAGGRAVKMVHLLLLDLPGGYRYRVILMRRAIEEVLASQQAMLARSGRVGAGLPAERLAAAYTQQIEVVLQALHTRAGFQVLEVQHRKCLEAPERAAGAVNDLLGGGFDTAGMAAAVRPGLHRQRRAVWLSGVTTGSPPIPQRGGAGRRPIADRDGVGSTRR